MENDLNTNAFISTPKSCLIAPAGFGKTFTIALSVKLCEGKQLILTHTNRGVHAVKKKLEEQKVPSNKYAIRTIDGFAKLFINSYPSLSDTTKLKDGDSNYWSEAIKGFSRLLELDFIKRVIINSFTGIYVDEYQDCNLNQHQMIMKLSEILPIRLLGDPLQGIYEFDKEFSLVNMNTDIPPEFVKYELSYPWRWDNSVEFGKWLKTVREDLINGKSIDLTKAPTQFVQHIKVNDGDYLEKNKLIRKAISLSGSVVVIDKVNSVCHFLAKNFSGQYQSDEEVSSVDLMDFANQLDTSTDGIDKAFAIFWIASKCFSTFKTKFGHIEKKLFNSKQIIKSNKYKNIIVHLQKLINDNDLNAGLFLMKELQKYRIGLYRRELWEDGKKTIELILSSKYTDSKEAARYLRNQRSIIARTPPSKLISRVFLVKGLEFDHAILINPESFNAKELYVALTRASTTLTVISSSPIICPCQKKIKLIKKNNKQLQLF